MAYHQNYISMNRLLFFLKSGSRAYVTEDVAVEQIVEQHWMKDHLSYVVILVWADLILQYKSICIYAEVHFPLCMKNI